MANLIIKKYFSQIVVRVNTLKNGYENSYKKVFAQDISHHRSGKYKNYKCID